MEFIPWLARSLAGWLAPRVRDFLLGDELQQAVAIAVRDAIECAARTVPRRNESPDRDELRAALEETVLGKNVLQPSTPLADSVQDLLRAGFDDCLSTWRTTLMYRTVTTGEHFGLDVTELVEVLARACARSLRLQDAKSLHGLAAEIRYAESAGSALVGTARSTEPTRQQVLWEPHEASLSIDHGSQLLPWPAFREELEAYVLPRVPNLPTGCCAVLRDFGIKRDWLISVRAPNGALLGGVWAGVNPVADWQFDYMLHVGTGEDYAERTLAGQHVPSHQLWASFRRLSTGRYERSWAVPATAVE